MKIMYGENKMSSKICEINNFEYLYIQIYTEYTEKYVTIFIPPDSLYPALLNHSHKKQIVWKHGPS